MSKFEEEYGEFIRAVPIDKNDLDNEAIAPPELYSRIADITALVAAERDRAKRDLAETEANADQTIREDAAASKDKLTEAEIKRLIILDGSVRTAVDKLAALTLETNRLTDLKESIAMRKDSFKTLSQLYHDQYWSREAGVIGRDTRRERVRESIRSNRANE